MRLLALSEPLPLEMNKWQDFKLSYLEKCFRYFLQRMKSRSQKRCFERWSRYWRFWEFLVLCQLHLLALIKHQRNCCVFCYGWTRLYFSRLIDHLREVTCFLWQFYWWGIYRPKFFLSYIPIELGENQCSDVIISRTEQSCFCLVLPSPSRVWFCLIHLY